MVHFKNKGFMHSFLINQDVVILHSNDNYMLFLKSSIIIMLCVTRLVKTLSAPLILYYCMFL